MCIHLLSVLAKSSKDGNWGALKTISDHINKFESTPPDSIRCALIQCACVIGTVSQGDALLEACNALSEELDLVTPKRFQSNRFKFVLQQLTTIMESSCTGNNAYIANTPKVFAVVSSKELGCTLPNVSEEIKAAVEEPFQKLVSLSCEVRELEGNALKPSTLLELSRLVMWFACMGSNKYDSVVESLLLATVKDPHPDFRVRRSSVPLICQYLAQWSEATKFFHELDLAILSDPSALLAVTDGSQQQELEGVAPKFETEIEFFAGCAIVCKELEIDCLYLLCVHASLYPSSMNFVQDALEFVAVSLNYPSRHSYILLHHRALVIKWFMDGRTLESFLSLRKLLCSESDMDNLGLLRDLQAIVVASLVAEDKKDLLSMASEMLGESTASLLQANMPSILAVHKMRSASPTSPGKKITLSTAPYSVLSGCISDQEMKQVLEERRLEIVEVSHSEQIRLPSSSWTSGLVCIMITGLYSTIVEGEFMELCSDQLNMLLRPFCCCQWMTQMRWNPPKLENPLDGFSGVSSQFLDCNHKGQDYQDCKFAISY